MLVPRNTGTGILISPHDRHPSSATGGHESGMTATQSHSGQPSLWLHRLLQKATGLGFPSQSGQGFVSSGGDTSAGRSPWSRIVLGGACALFLPGFATGGGLARSAVADSEAVASAEGVGGSPPGVGCIDGKISVTG